MKMRMLLPCAFAGISFAATGLSAADATNTIVTSPPVYVPDTTHANEPLPDGVLDWSSLGMQTNAEADATDAHFVFSFTNVSTGNVAILNVQPSCHCTVPELPPTPWIIPAGSNGVIGATVNLGVGATAGTIIKYITVSTDKGFKQLNMIINVLPPVLPTLTDAERARDLEIAKTDRQAIFKSDCATCHAKSTAGRYGKQVYDSVCAICHDGEHRAAFVPDLHNLKTPTNEEFWRTWTANGKPGSLMPAFSTAEGGPLNDMQIQTLAAYLNSVGFSMSAPVK